MSGAQDFTDRYNTPLDPGQELQYQRWLQLQSALNRRDMSRDTYDYDLRGAFKGGAGQGANQHYPDTFKKPNHPSFSDQSMYHGADGQLGGSWQQFGDRWAFTPGPTNLQMHGPEGLQQYFQQSDPNVMLNLPPQPDAQGYVRNQLQQGPGT